GFSIDDAELRWFPQNELSVEDKVAVKNLRIMEKLEELDDVQSVSSNLSITEGALAALETA
ncbi:MAG: YebC/PmpR family DNA-binding transcriptional regulator, partial [Anaerolineae bacterium]|nr:YebC/PmpR family DNA-binding transcriptional regulator [Anaerolineae bacterium]